MSLAVLGVLDVFEDCRRPGGSAFAHNVSRP